MKTRVLRDVVKGLRGVLSTDIGLTSLEVMLTLDEEGELTQRELCDRLGVVKSTMSRDLDRLSHQPVIGGEPRKGPALITMRTNPLERRQRLVSLTDRGRKFLAQVETEMKKATGRAA